VKALKPIVQLLAVAVVAFALWHYLFPPPERVIEKKLNALAEIISQNPQGNISKAANVNRIGNFFHPNVSINLEGFGRDVSSLQGRSEIEQTAMAVRQNNIPISVIFSAIHITVGPEETNASAIVTAEVKLNDQKEPIVQDIRLTFEKFDRSWLIRSATPAKGLKVE
jgi:hypothetical protein